MESNNVDGLPGFGPLREATVFLDYLKGFPNPSQAEKVVYPLKEVLLLSLLAVLANASNKNGDASLTRMGTLPFVFRVCVHHLPFATVRQRGGAHSGSNTHGITGRFPFLRDRGTLFLYDQQGYWNASFFQIFPKPPLVLRSGTVCKKEQTVPHKHLYRNESIGECRHSHRRPAPQNASASHFPTRLA